MKTCRTCKQERQEFWFSVNRAEKDGRCYECKECQRTARALVAKTRGLPVSRQCKLGVPGAVSTRKVVIRPQSSPQVRALKLIPITVERPRKEKWDPMPCDGWRNCRKCLARREDYWFSADKSQPSGLCVDCKECQRSQRWLTQGPPKNQSYLRVPGAIKSVPKKRLYQRKPEKKLGAFHFLRNGIKTCRSCKRDLPAARFSVFRGTGDDLNNYCRECNNAEQLYKRLKAGRWDAGSGRRGRPEADRNRRALARLERARHRQRQAMYDALICPLHFSIRVERQEKGRAHRMRCLSCERAKKKSPAALAWRLTPKAKEIKRLARKARKMRERGGGPMRIADIRKLFELYKACLACGCVTNLTIEHIIPLARGGTNAFENLQVLCMPCNSKKGVTTIDYRPRSDHATG